MRLPRSTAGATGGRGCRPAPLPTHPGSLSQETVEELSASEDTRSFGGRSGSREFNRYPQVNGRIFSQRENRPEQILNSGACSCRGGFLKFGHRGLAKLCRIVRLIAVRCRPLREWVCIFVWIQKCTKKITAVKKRPDAYLLSAEISQTRWRSDMRNFGRFASTGVRAAVSSRPTCFPSASSRQTAQGSTSSD